VFTALAVRADDNEAIGALVLDEYFAAVDRQRDVLKGTTSEVTLEGSLPKLKKQGRMNVLRRVSRLGEITYKMLGFTGDNTIKKEVIGQYLTAEAQPKQDPASISITPANYNFKYKGLQDKNETRVHVFELKPKKKRVGLFKGELWVDPETKLPVRESGRLVKNPSIFLKKVEFTREYEIADGIARPRRIESTIDTRIAGKALLAIDYANYRDEMPLIDAANNSQL
jgi:hypothetical protein